MNLLLSISADKYNTPLNFSEALGFGGQMVLIGMLAVFAVLGIIWAVLTVFKFVFTGASEKSVTQNVQPQAATPAPTASANDSEIVAVIAAAIAMAESESEGKIKFNVVSFRRK